MQTRQLGQSGLTVSALGLGCMGMSMGYGQADDKASMKTIVHAIEQGVSLLDTADVYGFGHNEALIGQVFAQNPGCRDKVVLATKCGLVGTGQVDASPAHIKKACDDSLKRLGVDVIDLYYLHRAQKEVPIEDSVGAFAELVQAGKVRHVGLSEVTVGTLERAVAVHPIAALQTEYSLWERKPEQGILAACRALNVGFVPYSPLGRGFLSGRYRDTANFAADDFRQLLPKFQGENLVHNLQLVDKLIEMSSDLGCTPAQLALAWLLSQGDDIVPIPGTRSIERLDENMGALNVALSEADVTALTQMGIATIGEQYPAAFNLEV